MLQKIKELCKEKGLRIEDLEAALGIANKSIYRWDRTNPGIDKVQLVADYFGISVDYLLGNEKDKEQILQEAFDNRPEMRMLFSVAENASKEDIEKAIKIIQALKGDDQIGR